jgi:hypothetical protein
MEKVFAAVVNACDPAVVRATTAIMDFIQLASLSVHTDTTISKMEDSLQQFHLDKQAFIDFGGREQEHFDFNKLHGLLHYAAAICSHGALDGYNTEWSERLHIKFAKKGYWASNHVNYTPQMTLWIRRQEAISFYRQYLNWAALVVSTSGTDGDDVPVTLSVSQETMFSIAKTAPWPGITAEVIQANFGCEAFQETVQAYVDAHSLLPESIDHASLSLPSKGQWHGLGGHRHGLEGQWCELAPHHREFRCPALCASEMGISTYKNGMANDFLH